MLPKEHRLQEERDFSRITRYGLSISLPFFNVKFYQKETGESRFGIVVSNKISKKATLRNTIKRRIREVLRKNKALYIPQTDTIIFAKTPIVNAPSTDIEKMTIEMFKRMSLSCKNRKK